ncbi:amino acid adenylation domain-containing protein [Actinokineospora diospyrosa]|uniref:Amino acid adenylation domain-containing protein n=1 Tax=Actinokineospora diospyrosa TaxID=103728 RepID=A0ABT1I606_9PSEU|nr:amino acid adenylation domain-containing protein [Actinokineospora diospyrosa]MCP2268012.1 amino acid adenylation domain-containing protein [Actinokineospora diospyrosa]
MAGISARFERWAARTPSATAVVAVDGELTYAQLDARASRFAARLTEAGVAPGDVVAVIMDRSLDLVVALLAVLKAGAAYLPLDPADPAIRRAAMVADVQPVLAVCDGPGLAVATDLPKVKCEPDGDPSLVGVPGVDGDLAYVMFTSGSTGRPKAVVVGQDNVLNLVTSPSYVAITPADRVLHFAPVAFDAATFEIWAPLLNGACVVIGPTWLLSAGDIADFMRDNGITIAWLTAALFHRQVDEAPTAFDGLHTVIAGGQVLSVPHVLALRSKVPDCRIVNGYGPTECTTFSTYHLVDGPVTTSVPIGAAIQGATAHVLDVHGNPATEGELHIGGAGVTRGYWRRPGLTAERFVPDPSVPGGRLYRTGDVVRVTGGVLEFLGRDDDQFKLRGHRIEPGEIENVLVAHPGVRQAAVVVDRAGVEPRLVAHVVASGPLNTRELRRFALARLPKHMVPTVFLPRAELPITRNGKTDRDALSTVDP